MAIKISGTTVIDDSRNLVSVGVATIGSGTSSIVLNGVTGIVSVGAGITINATTGDINTSGILTVSQLSVPFQISSFDPAIGSTSVGISSNIVLNFNQTVGLGTTGFFEIKTGLNTTGGTLFESISVGSTRATISNGGRRLTIDPAGTFGFVSSFYVTMSSGFVVANGSNFTGINTVGTSQTYYFTSKPLSLGDSFGGGRLICQSGGIRWIASAPSTEVSRNWYLRNDAVTCAQAVTGCTGWFIPSNLQFLNPGYQCRAYWDCSFPLGAWTNTEWNTQNAFLFQMVNGFCENGPKCMGPPTNPFFDCKARAFRCVTY
jgi:hypothetical protein